MSSILLNDLADDYLNPSSQGCINPLFASTEELPLEEGKTKKSKATILSYDDMDIDKAILLSNISELPPPAKNKPKKASVSVADCLACSGCLTSTEAVLVTNTYDISSLREAMNKSMSDESQGGRNKSKVIVYTVSEASIVDLARYFGMRMIEMYDALEIYLQQLLPERSIVINASTMAAISLAETTEEFMHRYSTLQKRKSLPMLHLPVSTDDDGPSPSVAISSEETHFISDTKPIKHNPGACGTSITHPRLPFLTSSCPGWVCYVEKTAPYTIPYMSTTKSPMAISGSYVKHKLFSTEKVFHVAIMPCHDKKLEASRKDLAWSQLMNDSKRVLVSDVDLSITTAELLQLMKESAAISKSKSLTDYIKSMKHLRRGLCTDNDVTSGRIDKSVLFSPTPSHKTSHSSSYADVVFRKACSRLFGVTLTSTELPWKQRSKRNSDLRELTLYKLEENGSVSYSCEPLSLDNAYPVLCFAIAYGFRNIQGILRRMKKEGRMGCHYHFVEIMACPSGCLNGGGQIRHDTHTPDIILQKESKHQSDYLTTTLEKERESPAEIRLRMEQNVSCLKERTFMDIEKHLIFRDVYCSSNDSLAFSSKPFGERARKFYHTRFHNVPKLELSSGAVEGMHINDSKW